MQILATAAVLGLCSSRQFVSPVRDARGRIWATFVQSAELQATTASIFTRIFHINANILASS